MGRIVGRASCELLDCRPAVRGLRGGTGRLRGRQGETCGAARRDVRCGRARRAVRQGETCGAAGGTWHPLPGKLAEPGGETRTLTPHLTSPQGGRGIRVLAPSPPRGEGWGEEWERRSPIEALSLISPDPSPSLSPRGRGIRVLAPSPPRGEGWGEEWWCRRIMVVHLHYWPCSFSKAALPCLTRSQMTPSTESV